MNEWPGMTFYSFNLGVILVSVQRDVVDNVTEIEEDKNNRRLFTTTTNVIRNEKVTFV